MSAAPTDRRLLACNPRVAHSSLRGQVQAQRFSDGTMRAVAVPVTPILSGPHGARDREMVLGEVFCVLEDRDGVSFGLRPSDGYVGYVPSADLGAVQQHTHRLDVPRSYAKPTADLKTTEPITHLPFGARVHVAEQRGDWAQITVAGQPLYTPACHLAPVDRPESDPVEVAARLLGTPYLWGGNSAFGIDCSGLVQAAFHACGRACPGDSDLQEAALGAPLAEGTPAQRGDLLFWKGHVALVSSPDMILHANAHSMNVAYEPLTGAIARIKGSGGGSVTAHIRP
ncbi:MAG: NlpC/P60 family protein [Pseudomonadota bacterium]|nr:NlpC/P60 family protein [Pseudomonadota bacterium]